MPPCPLEWNRPPLSKREAQRLAVGGSLTGRRSGDGAALCAGIAGFAAGFAFFGLLIWVLPS